MNISRFLAYIALLSALAFVSPLSAQGVDIIRGRVTGPDDEGIPNVTVTATTLSGQVSRRATSDKNGRYTISFPGGEGDYWVSFNAIGLAPRRYQVKRTADQEILIADARMAPATISLEALTVTSRAPAARGDTVGDVSGNERDILETDPALLTAEQMGDLAAMAASVPGVQLLPGDDGAADQFSVFGLGGDQNSTQLNGLSFGEGNIPRDAMVFASLATAPYDVSRGGFSGGQLTLRTRAGSNFVRRTMSTNIVAPQTQWTDRAAAASGQQYTNISIGGSASGPISPDRLFYNSSLQFDRRLNDLQTLLNTNALGFSTAGVSADSVARLLQILDEQGVPTSVSGFPGQRINNRGSFLTSLDFSPLSSARGNTYSMSLSGNINHSVPVGGGGGFGGGAGSALSTPSRQGKSLNASGSLQLRHSGLLGLWGALTESSLGLNVSRSGNDPYVLLPSASVRVNSQFDDGTAVVRNLAFGGSPSSSQKSGNSSLGFINTLSWFSSDNRHRVKLTSELRHESYWQDQTGNELGTFSFNSLADLEAGVPSSYSRQLSSRRRQGSQIVGAISLGDAWRPSNDLQIQYGVRMDGNRFLDKPSINSEVGQAFGLSNDIVPNRLYLSPRVGFSWTYGTADQVAFIPGMVRAPRAVIRGGIGVFQNVPNTRLVSGAIDNTGLPDGLQQLSCLGNATPSPDWNAYITDISSIPVTCADGTGGSVFANNNPNVQLFSSNFAAQRSIRSNLQWSGAILSNRLSATADVSWSRNLAQSAGFDLNFPAVELFNLENESSRPVYVSASSIVPATGQTAWRESRLVDDFGRVTQQRSDLKSDSKQLSLSIRPIAFNSAWSWSLSYVLSDVREQSYGFQSTAGNPTERKWARGNFSRHQIQYSLGWNILDAVRVNWSGNFRSGTPYTPLISGDVNGDGYSNDRAFIFDPSSSANMDPAVRGGMQALLANATPEAAHCLQSQMGNLADRNSCVGPWTSGANLSVSFNSLKIGLPQRATLSLQVSNPLGGIDRLVNGADNIKGWGQRISPDQQLLYVRGFDASSNTFNYEVNERFGSTRPTQSSFRQPVSVTAMLRFDVGPSRERQQLLQQLDRGRSRAGEKPSLQQIRALVTSGLVNPMQQILLQADSLKLNRQQADSLATLNRQYVLAANAIWNPVAQELAVLPDRYSHDAAFKMYKRARESSVDLLMDIVPDIRSLLTADQYRLLPSQISGFLDVRTLRSLRSGTSGGGGFGGFGGGGR